MPVAANKSDKFTIVGIGASAGGLHGFSEILSHLPDDTGMAFVLVQHLAPEQNSLLERLLERSTDIPIVRAEDGMAVAANRVHVIPPGVEMTIVNGQLQLTEHPASQPRGRTIDTFFCSLAEDCHNQAIAIVLSGSNDDGAAGIRAVRERGGITFAQDRNTAEFKEMPSAAIATGQVDFVLPPAKMAEELINISRHPYLREPAASDDTGTTHFGDGDLATVFALLRKHTEVDFTHYKRTTFERRLRRRMALKKLPDLEDYIELLEANSTEVQALFDDVLISVTSFFRDEEAFDSLKREVLPEILQQPSAQDSIRIWVAGCSTGEEAYSIAMCLLECLDSLSISPTIQIFATDVSEQAIDEARLGRYLTSRMEGVSPGRRQRFFSEVDGIFQINKSVRELCVFARHDLSSDPPFSDIDLVTCRNVLIYFQPPLQRHVLALFHYSLKPTGWLMLGNSETVGETSELFAASNVQHKVFKREAAPSRLSFDFVSSSLPRDSVKQQSAEFPVTLNRSSIQKWADQIVLNRYAPVGIVVNERLDIIQFRGETSAFLRPPLGEPSFNLLKMARPGLLPSLQSAITEAKTEGVAIRRRHLQPEDDQLRNVTFEVIPFNIAQGRCFLVLFEYETAASPTSSSETQVPDEAAASRPQTGSDAEAAQLRQELSRVRQELLDTQTLLQMTVAEEESTRQQLVAANEEVLSSNEELRSTNEELQTAKEEIQSSNEELKTTNEELKIRNEDWQRANDDLLNLINNVNIPIVMLSSDLQIRSFSPAARQTFNLIPSDLGRPINNIRPNVNLPALEQLVQVVIESLDTVEQEVQDQSGHWYLLRVRPYRTLENRIDGAVLALIDIDNLRRTEEELRESQAQLQRELSVTNQMRLLSLQLFSSLDLELALNEVLDAAIALLQADMGTIKFYDAEQNSLEIVAQRGFEAAFLESYNEASDLKVWASHRSVRQRRRVVIEDVHQDLDYAPCRPMADLAGYRAVQATPLLNRQGDVLAVLSTHFHQPHRPGDRELQLLDIYARQAAEFIQLVRAEKERQQLIEREQAAQAANASKDEFLSVLSHELRTPLNSILGWAQILASAQLSGAEREQAIAAIRDSAQAQLHLVDDLLDASRIIQERFQIDRHPVNLTEIMTRTLDLMRPQMGQKNLQLQADLEPSPEPLLADPTRMGQVFQNLLSNAIKFTPEEGEIAVRLVYSDAQVEVQISDTGIGVNPDLLPHIFNQFRQADSSNTRQQGGLGLGLFLVRSIVAAHGGTIQADSAGPDQGTTFTITLPRIPTAATAAEIAPSAPLAIGDSSLEGRRLLVVDDDAMNLQIYTFALENFGATVLVASSAADALSVLENESVDIIISDIGLPLMNGYEFMRTVRSQPAAGGQTPAIALSGYASQNDIQAALDAGFQIHLAKPVDLDELVGAVCSLIAA